MASSDGSFLLGFLIFLLVGLAVLFSFVMCCETVEEWVGCLLGLHKKNEILKFLGISMGGIVLVLQAVIANRRAKAMEDAANEQAKANQNTEQGQRQERLRSAIEHLGHEKVSVRLGGTYELFHLAQAPPTVQDPPNLRQNVLDILCSYIRGPTGEKEYREEHKLKPSEEVQNLLTLLFMQEHNVFKGLRANLQGSWLNGAYLVKARLEKADLTGAHLRAAELMDARLQGAELMDAYLQGAELMGAYLQGAYLQGTYLQGANLRDAHLQGAYLRGERLRGAHLQGAYLRGVNLQEAELRGAMLQGVSSQEEPQPVRPSRIRLPFGERIRSRIEQNTDLSGVIFEGGLEQEDLDSLVQGLPDEEAEELREKLASHVGKPGSSEPPEYIFVGMGYYTEKEADRWIAEYNEATQDIKD